MTMRPQGWLVACAVLLTTASSAGAGEARATIGVSATVLPHARILRAGGSDALLVSERDATLGMATARSVYEIRCNTRRGFALEFSPRAEVSEVTEVRVGQARVTLTDGPVALSLWDPAPSVLVEVEFRVRLRDGVGAGSYALPASVAVQPL